MLHRLVAVTAAVLLASTVVFAHLAVRKSLPEKGATVTASPTSVQVWFTQEPEMEKSGLTLTGPNGVVALGPVTAGPERSLVATVTGTLASGAYTLAWKTAGDDGHVLTGTIPFSVAPTAQ
jgi:methionine-rich copper-binding protein CopC